jgi:hypothetical protein
MRRMAILIAASASIASCDVGKIRAEGRPVQEVWGMDVPEVRIASSSSPLRAEREVPILTAPEIFAVYVPTRLDRTRDLMIGEHWIYFRLRDGEWFIERGRDPELDAAEAATRDDLKPLDALEGLDRAVIPWKEPRQP